MKGFALLVGLLLLVGCATPGRDQLSRDSDGAKPQAPTPSPQQDAPAEEAVITPRPDEICLKPEEHSGIIIDLLKYPTGHGWRVNPGWVVTIRATTIPGAIHFPRGVDRSTVRLSVQPSYWHVEPDAIGLDTDYRFWLLPEGKRQDQAKPGWLTLAVTEARDKEGKAFTGVPFAVRIFAYECLGTLAVQRSEY